MPQPLTPREQDVAALLLHNYTAREIGECLHISARTAEIHINHIKEKMQANNRAELYDAFENQGLLAELYVRANKLIT